MITTINKVSLAAFLREYKDLCVKHGIVLWGNKEHPALYTYRDGYEHFTKHYPSFSESSWVEPQTVEHWVDCFVWDLIEEGV